MSRREDEFQDRIESLLHASDRQNKKISQLLKQKRHLVNALEMAFDEGHSHFSVITLRVVQGVLEQERAS